MKVSGYQHLAAQIATKGAGACAVWQAAVPNLPPPAPLLPMPMRP